MVKKVAAFIIALFLITPFLFAQHVSWSRLPHAFRYEIEVERMSETSGQWEEYDTFRTSGTSYDFELPAGSYRFRITARNIIGIRGETSDWALFDVLETTQPYLVRDQFPVHKTYGVPAITRSIASERGIEKLTVKCYNCFFEDTRFSLIPVWNGMSYSNRFVPQYDRSSLPLPVAARDSEKGTVTLNLDWDKVEAGCYNLYVENSTGEHDTLLSLLVLPLRVPELDADMLPFDEKYKVSVLEVVSGTPVELSTYGENIQFDTVMRLSPVEAPANPYPFISTQPGSARNISFYCSNGTTSFTLDTEGLTTGYYSLVTETPQAGSTEIPLLIKVSYPQEDAPQIVKISGKFNRKNQTLELSVEDDRASFFTNANDPRVVLVSETDVYGENKRIQLRMTDVDKTGKKAVFETTATSVEAGTYALLLETDDVVRQAFVEISESLAVKEVELSDELIETQFMQPATEEAVAAKAEEAAMAAALGYRYSEAIPSLTIAGREKTDWKLSSPWLVSPATDFISDRFIMTAVNIQGNIPYNVLYSITSRESLDLLRQSEGMSFQSMVTERNNGSTKWKLIIDTTDGSVEIPIDSKLKKLTQTVVVWEDEGIQPEKITGVNFYLDARRPKEAGFDNTLEIYEAKTYSSIDPVPVLSFKNPVLFSTVGARIGFKLDGQNSSAVNRLTDGLGINPSCQFSSGPGSGNNHSHGSSIPLLDCAEIFVRLVDYGWASLDLSYYPNGIDRTGPMFGYGVRLAVPNKWVEPYVGLSPVKGLDGFEAFPWYAGLTFFNCIDVRYTCFWEWVPFDSTKHLQFIDNYLSIGLEIPIRSEKMQMTKALSPLVETETITPVFCTDLLLLPSISWKDSESGGPGYMHRLLDMGLGVRVVDFRFFEVDAAVTVRNIMDIRDRYELDVRGNWALKLPVRMFGTDVLTPSYGLGVGYRFNHEGYINQHLGLKIGKYINFSVNGNISLSKLSHVSDLINMAPILAPITAFSASDWWDISCGITIPLRKPVTREKANKEGI